MVDENEVKRWIARLETEESSWKNYERLAVLYAIRDQQSGGREKALPVAYSAAPAPASVETYGDSDFLRAVSKVSQEKAWGIMDELMDSLKIVNERVYNGVMRKLGSE